jgi:DNA-binding MurR/RpiR family transcriptional regulator
MIKKSNSMRLVLQGDARSEDTGPAGRPSKDTAAGPSATGSSDIFALILAREATFSKAHRRIAHAVLTHPQAFVEKPIEELAPWLGVSTPTITRFSHAVGCEGLRELKLRVMGSMRVGLRYLEPATPPVTVTDAVSRVVMRAHHAITSAQQTIDVALVERAAEMISRARVLYVFGGGGVSNWLIEEVQNRLFRLGLHVIPCADHQMQMMLAATMDRTDTLLCCSLTGRNAELIKVTGIAAQYGAMTIALTTAGTPLADAVGLAVTISVPDNGDVLGPTSMRYGFMTAIDMLAYIAAIRTQPAALETLRRIKQQFMTYRDEDDTQPLCD